jgi:hypothetical protein
MPLGRATGPRRTVGHRTLGWREQFWRYAGNEFSVFSRHEWVDDYVKSATRLGHEGSIMKLCGQRHQRVARGDWLQEGELVGLVLGAE